MGHDTWIEGTGSLFGVLLSGMCLLVGDSPQLLCFSENDTLKYFNPGFSTCYVVTGTDEKGALPDAVSVFPNPAEDHLSVSVKEQSMLPLKITFTDPAGRRILECSLTMETTPINLTGLAAPPVLFYTISGRNGNVSSGKVILLRHN